jgi:hypothetical protein
MEPSRATLKRILRRGIKQGLLPAALDMDGAMALLLGPLLYGHIFHKEAHEEPFDFGKLAAQSFAAAYGLPDGGFRSGTSWRHQGEKIEP